MKHGQHVCYFMWTKILLLKIDDTLSVLRNMQLKSDKCAEYLFKNVLKINEKT